MVRSGSRISKPLVLMAVLLAAAAAQLRPATAADGAEGFVLGVGQDVVDVLKSTQAGSDEREKELRQVFIKAFDTATIARFAMGRHWRRLSAGDKIRYKI